jgi:nitrite reductase (NADH) large subunit
VGGFASTKWSGLVEEVSAKVDNVEKILAKHGHGDGCEICKPAVASIVVSLPNKVVVSPEMIELRDDNDRALANMQRGGT